MVIVAFKVYRPIPISNSYTERSKASSDNFFCDAFAKTHYKTPLLKSTVCTISKTPWGKL